MVSVAWAQRAPACCRWGIRSGKNTGDKIAGATACVKFHYRGDGALDAIGVGSK